MKTTTAIVIVINYKLNTKLYSIIEFTLALLIIWILVVIVYEKCFTIVSWLYRLNWINFDFA